MAHCVSDRFKFCGRRLNDAVTCANAKTCFLLLLRLLERGDMLSLLVLEYPVVLVYHPIDLVLATDLLRGPSLLDVETSLWLNTFHLLATDHRVLLPHLHVSNTVIIVRY